MKKQLALGLAAVVAVSSLTGCAKELTESELRDQIAQLESELDKAQNNSDNTENNSVNSGNDNAEQDGNVIDSDPDRNPVVSEPDQEYQYPDMFDVLPYIDETPVSKFEYEYNNYLGGMIITSYKGQSPKIRIPDTIEGEPVVRVDLGEFSGATHLYLPDTVTKVDGICYSLEYINIPSAYNWGTNEWFFENSNKLISVYFDNGITEIGNDNSYIFFKTKYKEEFDAMTTITIPDTVIQSTGEYDFKGCKNATITYKGKSYTYSDKSAFFDLYIDLNGYNFYDNGLVVKDGTVIEFYYTNSQDIVIPNGITEIGSGAFCDCENITSVTLPEGVTKIGEYAFTRCTNLSSITIPDSIIEIGPKAFLGCENLKATYKGKTYSYNEISILCDEIKRESAIEIVDSKLTKCDTEFSGSIVIPDGVTEIGRCAFMNCKELTSVTIPDSVTIIGDNAFRNCTGLTSVNIPDSVTEIGPFAFEHCTGLTNITIPDSVTEIGDMAFVECKSIKATYKGKTYTYDQIDDLYSAINGN